MIKYNIIMRLCLLCIICVIAESVFAEQTNISVDQLDINASLRVRYENYNNFNLKKYGLGTDDELLLERLWLDFSYKLSDNAKIFLRLQDAHFWLSDFDKNDFCPACPTENPLDIREAYIELKNIYDAPIGIKAGRQTIKYGDIRIWGPGDWGNSGRYTWDAIKLLWEDDYVAMDLIYAKRLISDADNMDSDYCDYNAGGIYASAKNLPFNLDLFYVLKSDTHDTTSGESGTNGLAIHTLGARIDANPVKNTRVGGTLAVQFGKWGNDDIQASALNMSVNQGLSLFWDPSITLSYTYASGDSDPDDGTHETFDAVFGAPARYYGRMNLFSWMNLHDYQLDFAVKPASNLKAAVSYHKFDLAEAEDAWYRSNCKSVRHDTTGSSGRDVGQEIDVIIKAEINSILSIQAGYGYFFAGDFVKNTGEAPDADWCFLQTEIKF